jgi:sortase (surface protein transpeptidase)
MRWGVLVALLVGALCVGAPTSYAATRVIPTEIRIPSIGVDGQLMGLGLNPDRTLQTPPLKTPLLAGWYVGAPVPGDPGSAVVVAHVDGDGQPGLFLNLSKVKAGDDIYVTRSDGKTATFVVTQVAKYAKEPGDAVKGEQVFPSELFYSNQAQSELHLATCGGRYDAANRNYLDSIVVYSNLVSLR